MLTSLLIRIFVRNPAQPPSPPTRLQYGTLAGAAGIAVNILLFAVKLTAGIISGSISIMADAVNNLSDAGSSLITLIGFRISAKPADNEHPFGHGRTEYISGVMISVFIIAVGMNFFKESVMRIFSPSAVNASPVILGILGATIVFKLWLFFFFRNIAGKIGSETLRASAFDSLSDMLATALVTAALFCSRFTAFPVDGTAGTLLAAFIITGGAKLLREAVSPLLGERPDAELVSELTGTLLKCPGICGVHDIIMHNYGPDRYFATAHAEVSSTGDLMSAHDILEAAEVEVARKLPVQLILHCDPYNTADPESNIWRIRMENAAAGLDPKLKIYDFKLDRSAAGAQFALHFHLLIPRNYALNSDDITRHLGGAMRKYGENPELKINFINSFV